MSQTRSSDKPVDSRLAKCGTRRSFLKSIILLTAGIACPSFPAKLFGAAREMKMLVVYFSHSGNTRDVAREIQTMTGARIAEIKPTTKFPSNYDALVRLAEKQAAENFRPPFTVDMPENFSKCDIIFLGFPIWAYTMPMIVYSFLDKYHFAGQKIAPFCTHEGSGLADSREQISRLCPDAEVLPGLAVRGRSAADSTDEVKNWLKKLGIIK